MIDLKKLDAIKKIAQRVALLSLVIFIILIAFSGYKLYSINRQIDDKSKELEDKTQWVIEKDKELAGKQAQLKELTDKYATLNRLYSQTVAASPESAKQAAVQEIEDNPKTAQATIAVIEANPVTARILPPRVYIQIKDDSQRARAKEVVEKLKAAGFITPNIENVGDKSPSKSELRYFNQSDVASNDVRNIVEILQGENISVQKSFMSGQENSNKIRARHYELWFGADFPPPVRPPYRLPGIEKLDKPVRVKPVQ